MVLGCPKCILGKFRIFLKKFFIFSPLLDHFSQGFWDFFAKNEPKIAESGVWKTFESPNFEKILFLGGCDGSRMPKMYSGEV